MATVKLDLADELKLAACVLPEGSSLRELLARAEMRIRELEDAARAWARAQPRPRTP